jgi:integrase
MHVPKLCDHKPGHRGYVTDPDAKVEVYLGVYGTQECKDAYMAWVADFLVRRGQQEARRNEVASGTPTGAKVTLKLLCDDFMAHARVHYRKHGKPTSEVGSFKRIAEAAVDLWGTEQAAIFTPRKLRAVRDKLVKAGGARGYVNRQIGRLKEVFRWGVEMELAPVAVLATLREVADLQYGRCPCPEEKKLQLVPLEIIRRSIRAAKPKLAQMIGLQLAAAMRPGEVCIVRPCDIDQCQDPWLYIPWTHKNEHKDRQRQIWLGQPSQEILAPLLANRNADCWLFPGYPKCNSIREQSYYREVTFLCRRSGIPHWFPLQLRHTALTMIRRAYGLDGAQVAGGHAEANVTEMYTELDVELARRIASEFRLNLG